jgi:diaminopimelate decarboxylase
VGEYAKALHGALGDACAAARLTAPRLLVEPGRSIAARAALTLFRVGTVKRIPDGPTYVAVDGGMSDNPRPVLYGAGYEVFLPARIDESRPLVASIAGKHCEQGDIVVADARLPAAVAVGDLLAVPVTGAYGYSMASNYNKVPRPAVVFVRDGRARVVVRRETLDDLLRLDAD